MHKLVLNNPNTHSYCTGSCMHESFYPWSKFPALGISIWTIYIHLQRRDKNDEKLSTYKKKIYIYIYFMERRKRERSSLQSKHEGKMMVGSSPGSCTPMQVQVSISHCCTREASMNRQLQPTTSPPGLDRRELFDRFSSPSSSSSSSSYSWLHSSHSKIYSHPVIFRLVARST